MLDNIKYMLYNVIEIKTKGENHMEHHLVAEDAFVELSILREKAEAVLSCLIEDSKCARDQTAYLYIANDYLSAMSERIQAMQGARITIPPSPAHRTSPVSPRTA